MNNGENKNDDKIYYEYQRKYIDFIEAEKYNQSFKLKSSYDYFNIKKLIGFLVAKREQNCVFKLLFAVGPIQSVLDVPCGTGKLIKDLLNNVKTEVIGIDASEAMLLKIETRDNRLKLITADIDNIPLDNDFVDLTICHRFLHRMSPENVKLIMKEIYRVSKEYAIFYFAVKGPLTNFTQKIEKLLRIGDSKDIFYMTKKNIKDQVIACGWDSIKEKSVLPMGISTGYLILVKKRK
jgi:ubiquinone/menaquinone biosynthesis C-methylase UbiE